MKIKRLSYILFLIGLSIFMYPHVHKILFDAQNITAFNEYENVVTHMSDEEIRKYIQEFQEYNEYIANDPVEQVYVDPFIGGIAKEEYVAKTVTSSGAFGYIEIPKIRQTLPIFLGASLEHLAKGVAQLEETSLPIGGIGTNSVIAGHRGYSKGALLFKHLDQLAVGDRFYIHVYDMTLTYEVVGTEVILPTQTEKLMIDPMKDMVTLLTCTPYRVSTHRLLVYALRVQEESGLMGLRTYTRREDTQAGVLSASATKERAVSSEVMNDNYLSYAVVGIGSLVWVTVFILLLRTFRRQRSET